MHPLKTTQALLEQLQENKTLEEYAILVGYQDQEWALTSGNVNLDTYFDIASMGKIFPTTTLALMAVSEGKLALTDTLDHFFPFVPEDKKQITVRHLMTHTSGMLRWEFPDDIAQNGREGIARWILQRPLDFATGTRKAYSCNAMILLGFILEKIWQQSLDVLFRQRVLQPLGLSRSRYNIAKDEPNAVLCCTHSDEAAYPLDDGNVRKMKGIPAGNGGNFSTANDLRAFVKALLRQDPKLYSKELFALAETNLTKGLPVLDEFRGKENHGLGYVIVDENCPNANTLFPHGSIGHSGFTGQSFFLNRELGLYVIQLTNAARCSAQKHGHVDSLEVRKMRADLHTAIKKDLAL